MSSIGRSRRLLEWLGAAKGAQTRMSEVRSYDDRLLSSWADAAQGLGLLALGAVNLDDPGFAPAHARLDRL